MAVEFGVQFYPTPDNVVEKMMSVFDIEKDFSRGDSIIDPSCGDGGLLKKAVKYITEKRYESYKGQIKNVYWCDFEPDLRLYGIEVDDTLAAAARENGITIVGKDFLGFKSPAVYDYVLMNPPFASGAKHLLRAWNVFPSAKKIVCLLNTETVNNPFTPERRELLELIEHYGNVEVLGQVFKDSENPTDVSVSMVVLTPIRNGSEWFSFQPDDILMDDDDDEFENAVANMELEPADAFTALEQRYNVAVNAMRQLVQAAVTAKHYIAPVMQNGWSVNDVLKTVLSSPDKGGYNAALEVLTSAAWDFVFSKTKISKYASQGVQRELASLQSQAGKMAFTRVNMEDLFSFLFLNREQIYKQTILEAFDLITKYHHENRLDYEGWKTNSVYKVQRRFIMPYMIDDYLSDGYARLRYEARQIITDIEKALCFVSGLSLIHI